MSDATTLSRIKLDLRITHTALDADISSLIDECLGDLGLGGVSGIEEDKNIFSAIRLYVKAGMSPDPDVYNKWYQMYERKKAGLMMARTDGYVNDEVIA